MPRFRCPACDVKFRLEEEEVGKKVECPECGERFRPPDPDEDAAVTADVGTTKPRRRRDWGDGDEREPVRRKKSSTGKILLIVGGILLALLIVCGGVVGVAGYFMFRAGQEIQREVVKGGNFPA